MKVIANIPEEMVQELKDGCFGAKHTLYDLAGAICDGVVLPDNATNGDVIKAMFPDATVYSYKDSFCEHFGHQLTIIAYPVIVHGT